MAGQSATVFPQAVGLAATWDPELVSAVGAAAGHEMRALHRRDPAVSLNVWAPVVNLLRDPPWGRNEEGYSEDPLLTGCIAPPTASGLRGDDPRLPAHRATLKHFLGYNNEDRPGPDLVGAARRGCCTSTSCRRFARRSQAGRRPASCRRTTW